MPKKIENARELLLREAKRLLNEEGYEKLTMRSVANACGLGVGTAYNYFPSKNTLVASVMLEDWRYCLEKMRGCSSVGMERLSFVYTCLGEFLTAYQTLFCDEGAKASYNSSAADFHKPLRSQLAEVIFPVCEEQFLSEFLAESILRWIVEGVPFETLQPLFYKLINKNEGDISL